MIATRLRVLLLIAVCIYFIMVFCLLRRKTLNLKYTLLWLASGFASLVGIYDPMNALFSLIIFCILIILMSLTAIVSKLNRKTKTLIQALALLEKRVRDSEDISNEKNI